VPHLSRFSVALISVLTALAAGVGPSPRTLASAAAPAPFQASSCAAGIPAPVACDRTLGVALTVPRGWSVVPPGKLQSGTLAFWTLTPGTQEPPLRLVIAPIGLATSCGDAQAARAVADAMIRASNSPRPIMSVPGAIGGAPAVTLNGLPGAPDYSSEIVVAHDGAVYSISTFGSGGSLGGSPTLTSDQRAALSSLRFIARSGPFPSRPDRFVTPALRGCAAVRPERLSLEDVLAVSPLTLYVDGLAFAPAQPVTLHMTWRGIPLASARPRYTSYTSYEIVRPGRTGFFVARLSVPVSGAMFASFTAHIVATNARGACRAVLDTTFRDTGGGIIPTRMTMSNCGGASE